MSLFHPSKMGFVINSDEIILTKKGTFHKKSKRNNEVLGKISDPIELEIFHSILDFDESTGGGFWMCQPDMYLNFLRKGTLIGNFGVIGQGCFRNEDWDSDFALKAEKIDYFTNWLIRNNVKNI